MAKKRPAYQWYPKDYDSDEVVRCMTAVQEYAYRRLLDHQWIEGSLPADLKRIALLVPKSGTVDDFIENVWPAISEKFCARQDGRLVNQRLERQRSELEAFITSASAAGQASADARKHRYGTARPPNGSSNEPSNGRLNGPSMEIAHTPERTPERLPNSSSSSSSSSSSPISDLRTTKKDLSTAADRGVQPPPPPRGKQFARIFLQRWQIDDLIEALGPHADTFDLDAWVLSLSDLANAQGLVLEKRNVWPWVQGQLSEEVRRRGLPVAAATSERQSYLPSTESMALFIAEKMGLDPTKVGIPH